jgi:Bacteriophage Lambda NinG protein
MKEEILNAKTISAIKEGRMISKPPKKVNLDYKLIVVFAMYIRVRDALATTGTLTEFVCCTCGRKLPFSRSQDGHCFQRDRAGTRFEETNNHAQCDTCNGDRKSRGQFFAHKAFIRQKYGQAELDRLEYLSKKVVIQRRDDWYLEKIEGYKQKLASLKGDR